MRLTISLTSPSVWTPDTKLLEDSGADFDWGQGNNSLLMQRQGTEAFQIKVKCLAYILVFFFSWRDWTKYPVVLFECASRFVLEGDYNTILHSAVGESATTEAKDC